MKIVLFTENSYAGGLDTVIATLIDAWPRNENEGGEGDEFVLICNRSHPGLDVIERRLARPVKIVAHDAPLHWEWVALFDRPGIPGPVRKVLSVLSRYPFFLYWLFKAKTLLAGEAADRLLVVNGGYPAGDSCRAAACVWPWAAPGKPPCVFNFHNLAVAPRGWERWIEGVVDGLVLRGTGVFVAVSKACAGSMANRPVIAGSGRVTHIHNGIAEFEPPSARPHEIREGLDIPAAAPLCLMLGTYEPRKGHAFLLGAFKRVLKDRPDAFLVICGHGAPGDVKRVRALVDGMGLGENVRLEGFREDVAALIEAAHILAVSSQAFESFGLTIVEAMARATPVVATDVGGIPEVIGEDEGGYCLPAADEAGFAARIVCLLEDEGLRKRMGEKGRRRFLERFTARRMAREYASLVWRET